jgi:hypothetical protein
MHRQRVSSCSRIKSLDTANSSQFVVEHPKERLATSITCLLSTVSKPLSGPWGVFAAISLLSARRPVAKLVSAAHWMERGFWRCRLLVPLIEHHWIPATVAALPDTTKPRRDIFVCVRVALEKTSSLLPRTHRWLSVPALVAPRVSPLNRLPIRAELSTIVARK